MIDGLCKWTFNSRNGDFIRWQFNCSQSNAIRRPFFFNNTLVKYDNGRRNKSKTHVTHQTTLLASVVIFSKSCQTVLYYPIGSNSVASLNSSQQKEANINTRTSRLVVTHVFPFAQKLLKRPGTWTKLFITR